MNNPTAIVTIPPPVEGIQILELDFTELYISMGRVEELATMTSMKGPELLKTFIKGYSIAIRYTNMVELQKNKVAQALERRKAILLVDEIGAVLAAKRLKDTQSNREAIISLDDTAAKLSENLEQLIALEKLLKGHQKVLEMGYTGVKKILGEHNPGLMDRRHEFGAGNGEVEGYFGVPRGR